MPVICTDEELFSILNFTSYTSLCTLTLGLVVLPDASWNANIWRDVCRLLSSLPACRASVLDVTFELCTDRLGYPTHIALEANWRALDETLLGRCRTVRFVPARKMFSIPTQESFCIEMQRHFTRMLPGLIEKKVLRF